MDRLTAEVRDGEETSYLYDLCGNRLEKRKGGKTERYRYNRKNQLVRRAAGGGAWDYTYDLQGNLVRETGPKGERQYLYDAENRQIRVLSGGKEIQEDRYDGEGMRAGLTVNGKKSTFLYADQRLYAEFDETGADVSRYIWGDGLVGLGCQGQLYGVHRDEQLSTRWITGGEGDPENAYEYDAFGVLLGNHGKVPGRLLYGGQQYDAEVEQYYLRARYYNPVVGRFMQEDTYRGDGLNLYAYCANDPVMYHDPSGRNADCNHTTNAEENVQQENVTGKKANNKYCLSGEEHYEAYVEMFGAESVEWTSRDTLSSADRLRVQNWEYRPTDELYLKYKDVYQNNLYFDQATGKIYWPKDDGFAGYPDFITLSPGTIIDRYGSDYGTFTSPVGIPYDNRALAPDTILKPYSIFEVVEPIDVQSGEIAPWFDQPGGGTQYILPDSVNDLINAGKLRRME